MRSNDQVTGIVSEITAATREQSQGFAQVSGAIDNIDEMTTHNAQLVRESNAAADALKGLADHLAHKVSIFRFDSSSVQVQVQGQVQVRGQGQVWAPVHRPAALPAPSPEHEAWA